MALHVWWARFGHEVEGPDELTPVLARDLALAAARRTLGGITVSALRQSPAMGYAGVYIDVEVERPQELAHPIRRVEPIAILFPFNGSQPSVLALREDFPDTPHQNWSPAGGPCALCIDDRPWAEARLTVTGYEIARRIQLWLSRAARGELHDPAQPPDPLFFASQLGLVLPASVVMGTTEPVELVGSVREDNADLILTATAGPSGMPPAFTVLAFKAQRQEMTRLRYAPRNLAALASELEGCGIGLLDELKARLKAWAGLESASIQRLATRLAIVITFPIATGKRDINDLRAFMAVDTAGDIGVALGVLHANESQVGDKRAFVPAIPEAQPSKRDLRVEPAQVHFAPNREIAAVIAGRSGPDSRRAVLVGAGSLGSQLGLHLAREGSFAWTVVDDDYVLPHNLVRHALFGDDIGAPKASALAHKLASILAERVTDIQCNILQPNGAFREQLTTALAEADIIVDASASVAVSRHLSDLPGTQARRICAFFNPAGTSVVLLAENDGRDITLRDLEAQYHRMLLSDSRLSGHLLPDAPGIRFSGSCRALTNKIPASNAALLSALASRGTVQALASGDARISVWNLAKNGEVDLVEREGETVTRTQLGDWTLAYDTGLLSNLAALRRASLPNETGGVLLGIADMSQKTIHIAHALPEPEDSQGTEFGFERGIVNLQELVGRAVAATMHQLRYVGEWHSHPDWATALPSSTDLNQLVWLGQELEIEGLPGLMAIAAQDGRFTFCLGRMSDSDRGSDVWALST